MISVILPAFNAADVLPAQLDALVSQSFNGEWEVLIADNGSSDATVSVAQSYSSQLPGLRVVHATHRRGPAAARNVAARAARGSLLLFCDADDVVSPNWVSAFHQARNEAQLLTGPIAAVKGGVVGQAQTHVKRHMGWTYAISANLAVTRGIFAELGGFDESLLTAQDVDFSWRAQLAGSGLAFVPNALVHKGARESDRQLMKQYYRYGLSDPLLLQRYRSAGLKSPDFAELLRAYGGAILLLPLLWHGAARERWIKIVGRRLGRLVGSVKHRTWCP